MNRLQTNYSALTSLVTVFFFWGFIASSNSVFIPFCKNYFNLDQFLSQLIDFAFYFAYFVSALIIFGYLQLKKVNVIAYWGYKKSIIIGLLVAAVGAITMNIAVFGNTFNGLLIGLFIMAFGFSLQQMAAQPLAISLGPSATGAHRINLGGAVNSLGTTIGPVLIGIVLFGSASVYVADDQLSNMNLEKMVGLYSGVFFMFILAAIFFGFNNKIPTQQDKEENPRATKAFIVLMLITSSTCFLFFKIFMTYANGDALIVDESIEQERFIYLLGVLAIIVGGLILTVFLVKRNKKASGWGAMRHAHLVWGMLAIFFYVGVEVAIASNLGELLKDPAFGGYQVAEVPPFISLYWGSLMMGRWAAAVEVFSMRKITKITLQSILPIIAFALILVLNLNGEKGGSFWDTKTIDILGYYSWFVILFIGLFHWSKNKPRRTLIILSSFGLVMVVIGLLTSGLLAVFAFVAGGLACSILWPSIFSLSLANLGRETPQGSAFLIMMILGGAVLPPIQGKLADLWGIHLSFIVPALCFAYLIGFGYFIKGILARINVDYDKA